MCKQLTAVVFMVLNLSILSNVLADYPVIPICVGETGNQVRPSIDGRIAAWEDGYDISWADLSGDPSDWTGLSIPGTQDYCAVGGGRIVWRDRLDSDDDIGGYDIAADSFFELNFGDGPDQRYPQVSDAFIICEDKSGGVYSAAVYNETAGAFELIAPGTAMQTDLAIDGSVVVWRDDRDGARQIYRCDLAVTPWQAGPIDPSGTDQWYPDVSGSIVVWQDHRNYPDVQLVAYDTAAGAVVWTHTEPGEHSRAAVSDGLIVWQDQPEGQDDFDIRGYDLATGAWLEIATGGEDDRYPAVSGRTVVWQRNGTDIVGAVIPIPSVMAVTEPAAGRQILSGDAVTVSWEMVEGPLPDEVAIDFSADDGDTWQVVEPNVPADAAYAWSPTPAVDSQHCRIRISSVSDTAVSAVSEAFTIFQCDASLTADVTGDCFVGLDDFAVLCGQWLACGNPYDAACVF